MTLLLLMMELQEVLAVPEPARARELATTIANGGSVELFRREQVTRVLACLQDVCVGYKLYRMERVDPDIFAAEARGQLAAS